MPESGPFQYLFSRRDADGAAGTAPSSWLDGQAPASLSQSLQGKGTAQKFVAPAKKILRDWESSVRKISVQTFLASEDSRYIGETLKQEIQTLAAAADAIIYKGNKIVEELREPPDNDRTKKQAKEAEDWFSKDRSRAWMQQILADMRDKLKFARDQANSAKQNKMLELEAWDEVRTQESDESGE